MRGGACERRAARIPSLISNEYDLTRPRQTRWTFFFVATFTRLPFLKNCDDARELASPFMMLVRPLLPMNLAHRAKRHFNTGATCATFGDAAMP